MTADECTICGKAVPHPMPGSRPVCAKIECRNALFQQVSKDQMRSATKDNRNDHQQQLGAVRNEISKANDTQNLQIGIVPFMDRPVEASNNKRHTEFLANLHGSLSTILAPEYETKDVRVGYGSSSLDDVRKAACTACRGVCCNQGETHAFLQPANLEKLVDVSDEDALEKTMAMYGGFLPTDSVEDSCIFHTASGCALPRDHRSQTCNSFRCPQLRNIETFAETLHGETLLVAAVKEDQLRAVETVTV